MLNQTHGAQNAISIFQARDTSLVDETISTDGGGIYNEKLNPWQFAERVIADTLRDGDRFLLKITKALEGITLDSLEVPRSEIVAAKDRIDSVSVDALERAADRVSTFQARTLPKSWRDEEAGYGEIVQPLQSAGCCIPAGTAPLASTVIMTAIPAKVAGVPYVSVVTPAMPNGLPHPAVLASCYIAGVDRVFRIGGAQAVAALAVGTQTIPKVDIVCGPGSIWVTAAKQAIYGKTGIDGVYGPTETMVIADDNADAEIVASDLIAQAEHDPLAAPVLVALSQQFVDSVEEVISKQLESLPRSGIAKAAITNRGSAVIVDDVDEALKVAEAFAPEHLCLAFDNAEQRMSDVRNAGGIFVGERSGEVMADYVAGPSHVMPTAGSARWASALSARNFVRVTPFLDMDEDTFLELSKDASNLARLEELEGHARAADIRRKNIIGE